MPRPDRTLRGGLAHATGIAAEAAVAARLAADGWTVLGARVRTAGGEIDLIAEQAGLLAFIEIKARPTLRDAAEALQPRQRARLLLAAECWLGDHPGHGAAGIRFDVILVAADGAMRRIADAFRQGDA